LLIFLLVNVARSLLPRFVPGMLIPISRLTNGGHRRYAQLIMPACQEKKLVRGNKSSTERMKYTTTQYSPLQSQTGGTDVKILI
jgi:hypothetical protein